MTIEAWGTGRLHHIALQASGLKQMRERLTAHASRYTERTLPTAENQTVYSSIRASPIGELLLGGDGTALTDLYLPGSRQAATFSDGAVRADGLFEQAALELEAYFAGQLRQFTVALAPRGTPFQRQVWAALSMIPYGTTTSYGQLAEDLERPSAARAVGLANARNPISIMIPCHRLIGAAGSLVGYGGGLERKRWLLDLEARVVEAIQ